MNANHPKFNFPDGTEVFFRRKGKAILGWIHTMYVWHSDYYYDIRDRKGIRHNIKTYLAASGMSLVEARSQNWRGKLK
jgi:hypothetical protein